MNDSRNLMSLVKFTVIKKLSSFKDLSKNANYDIFK